MIPDSQTLYDTLDPARAAALWATLDLPGTPPGPGEALPPFFHHLYFWTPEPPGRLGRDGHPSTGGLIPDMGTARRMWAGGRLSWRAPLRAGRPAVRMTTLQDSTRKTGRSGPLAFVTLRHEIHQDGALCLIEDQDLVYRTGPPGGAAPAAVPEWAQHRQPLTFDSTALFRYSALTFNGHRIHYDADYARDSEGYGGLVVHGPLLAQHLMLWAARHLGPLSGFDFRLTAPLICGESGTLCARGPALWVEGGRGQQCITARATAR